MQLIVLGWQSEFVVGHHQSFYLLHIAAEADSTFLVRITGALASLNLVAASFHSQQDADDTAIAVVLIDATERQADLLKRKLMQMTVVRVIECEPATSDQEHK